VIVNVKLWISSFFLVFVLIACSGTSDVSLELSGLNYTDTWVTTFSVDGYHGPGVSPNGGGGKFVCCVNIPRRWRAGMKVTVRWTEDDRVSGGWKERVVGVPEYTEQNFGSFVVHFYPGDIVKVLVTQKMQGHPDYPYPRPK
jgi:hypothetical protein